MNSTVHLAASRALQRPWKCSSAKVYFLKSLPVYRGSFHVSALGELVCVIQGLGFPSILIICLHFPSSFRRSSLACCVQQLECGGLLDGSMAVRFESGNRSRYASTQKDIRGFPRGEVIWPCPGPRRWGNDIPCGAENKGLVYLHTTYQGSKQQRMGVTLLCPVCDIAHFCNVSLYVWSMLRSVTTSFSFRCYWY